MMPLASSSAACSSAPPPFCGGASAASGNYKKSRVSTTKCTNNQHRLLALPEPQAAAASVLVAGIVGDGATFQLRRSSSQEQQQQQGGGGETPEAGGEECWDCGGTRLWMRCKGEGFVFKQAAAAARLPPAAVRRLRSPLSFTYRNPSLLIPSAHSNITRVVQTASRVGKDAVEAGTNLVPGSVPRPIARIGVTFAAVSVALFLLKSIVSTAFFVLAMMGLIYLGFLALNPKEVTGSRADESGDSQSEDPIEEARRIMEKYK